MLKDLLAQKNCFKLICGAGNQNLEEVARLVAVYSKAGCRFFDFAADEEVLKAAQKGLDFSIPKDEQKDYHFCISIGTKGDQHVQKVRIDSQKCKRCEKCVKICPQKAINQYFKVAKAKCIGCLKCKSVCRHGALEVYSEAKPINFSTYKHLNLSCIELHASGTDELEVEQIWDALCYGFDGLLSLCVGKQKLTEEQVFTRVQRLVKLRPPYTTIVQADGVPMSGADDELETTRAAVEMGKLIQSFDLPIYLLLSGGTNSKTAQLAKSEGLEISGVAMGSYARAQVKDLINHDDFWINFAVQNEAFEIAKLVIKGQ